VTLGSLSDRVQADWNGSSYSAAARATYKLPLGWLDVKPFVGIDYIGFNQDSYEETATTEVRPRHHRKRGGCLARHGLLWRQTGRQLWSG